MPSNYTIAIIAVQFFFAIIFLVFFPDLIAWARGVKIKPRCEFGGDSEDLIVALIFFPIRMCDALTAKSPPESEPEAIEGSSEGKDQGKIENKTESKIDNITNQP